METFNGAEIEQMMAEGWLLVHQFRDDRDDVWVEAYDEDPNHTFINDAHALGWVIYQAKFAKSPFHIKALLACGIKLEG